MTESTKRPRDYLVPEPARTIAADNLNGHTAPSAEVPRLPRDGFAGTEQPAPPAQDDPLAGVGGGIQVKVDAEREVETPLGRRVDQRLQLDQNE
ncbi:MAG TPA: hypothetical protein VHS03_13745 [Gaiellaceae bacterium]|nr:hypothetical protein [Gaiellaceae bacterium]